MVSLLELSKSGIARRKAGSLCALTIAGVKARLGRAVYLEVRYQELSYFVYATPAPGGLHVSTWLFSKHELWQQHPLLKWIVAFQLTQMTLFQFDIMRLFHGLFHGVVQGALGTVLDELRREQGLLPLESYERRPVLSGFYASMCYGAGAPAVTAPGMVSPVTLGGRAAGRGLTAPSAIGSATLGLTGPTLGRSEQDAGSPEPQRAEWDIAEPPLAEPPLVEPPLAEPPMVEPQVTEPQGVATLGATFPTSRFAAASRVASLAPGADGHIDRVTSAAWTREPTTWGDSVP